MAVRRNRGDAASPSSSSATDDAVNSAIAATDEEWSKQAAEGATEVLIENGVDDGIERAVEVAEPRDHVIHRVRHAVFAECYDDVSGEERRPAHEEHAHNDAQGYCRFMVGRRVGYSVRRRSVNRWRCLSF